MEENAAKQAAKEIVVGETVAEQGQAEQRPKVNKDGNAGAGEVATEMGEGGDDGKGKTEVFGPWMLANRVARRRVSNQRKGDQGSNQGNRKYGNDGQRKTIENQGMQSRFNALHEAENILNGYEIEVNNGHVGPSNLQVVNKEDERSKLKLGMEKLAHVGTHKPNPEQVKKNVSNNQVTKKPSVAINSKVMKKQGAKLSPMDPKWMMKAGKDQSASFNNPIFSHELPLSVISNGKEGSLGLHDMPVKDNGPNSLHRDTGHKPTCDEVMQDLPNNGLILGLTGVEDIGLNVQMLDASSSVASEPVHMDVSHDSSALCLVRDIKRRHKVDFLAILEPRQSGSSASNIIKQFGFQEYDRVDAVGFSGGICPQASTRRELWHHLNILSHSITELWSIAGDFNAFLYSFEKRGGSSNGSRPDVNFVDWIEEGGLMDIGYTGNEFTWSRGNVSIRLDRVIINDRWRHIFNEANVVHLPRYKSDHNPLWIRFNPLAGNGRKNDRPFRFLAPWVMHEDFGNLIRKSWREGVHWGSALHDFYGNIKEWNKKTFGNIFANKERILNQIQSIEQKIVSYPSVRLKHLQENLWQEYEKILDQEEVFWMQKSRCQWTVFGDRNTRFFHTATMVRRKRNKIEALMNNAGEWIYDSKILEKMSADYFHELYSEDGLSGGPKGSGGLGMRHLKHQNAAFMTKIGWGLVNQKDALWARVLRGKYHCGDDLIPQMKCPSNSSRLWKAVVRNWGHVSDGMEWRVGNGASINFWTDCWVPNCKRLCDIASIPIPSNRLSDKVSEYVTPSGDWDWNSFQFLIPEHARSRIAAIMPPSDGNGHDKLAWKFGKDGCFSVKTAYQNIAGMNEEVEDNFWRKVWLLRVPQRTKSFMWLCGHNKLLTNSERVKRCMTDSSTCTRCNRSSEDTLHALRDCPKVKSIWMRLVKPGHWPLFFSADLKNWLEVNMKRNFGSTELEWRTTFAITCWSLWRWRNEHVFGLNDGAHTDIFFTIIQRVRNCRSDFGSLLSNAKKKPDRVVKHIRWLPPEAGWVKVNVDGACSSKGRDHGHAACGGVVRDENGNYMVGFLKNLGSCSPIQAELWGVHSGLSTAWLHGFRRVIIEVDSMVVCGMMQGLLSDSHPCAALVRQIHGFLGKDWEVRVQHTYREGNHVADAMARAAYQSGKDLSFVTNPPVDVAAAMISDMSGSVSVRAVVAA
ncbi:ribonuclease H [Senna tora]|uniref:Ribonuclease H n=1 Tax=Senna tora TaxID=362788 RepID=A0A835CEV7_9FABA|nr:ribonuclease H [Senna tora]